MTRNVTSWLVYARLRRQDGARVIALEVYASIGIAALFIVFWAFIKMPGSFSKDGLIDGLGSITAVLAGFYVAGLVAIATFFRENSSLDDIIESGPAILNRGEEDEEHLTRRQYVCSIFGFLVGMSFTLAISAVLLRAASPATVSVLGNAQLNIGEVVFYWKQILEGSVVFGWIFLFVWQIILTLRGLFYLMDKIYDVRPVLGKPKDVAGGSTSGAKTVGRGK